MTMGKITPRENRIMIDAIREDISCMRKDIKSLINHYSKRLPAWATIVITILGSSVTGLIVAAVK